MQALFDNGRIIDLVLAILVVEAILAAVWLRRAGRPTIGFLANVAAGACLLLGVRAALIGSEWPSVALWVGLSLPCHVVDLASRWRR